MKNLLIVLNFLVYWVLSTGVLILLATWFYEGWSVEARYSWLGLSIIVGLVVSIFLTRRYLGK